MEGPEVSSGSLPVSDRPGGASLLEVHLRQELLWVRTLKVRFRNRQELPHLAELIARVEDLEKVIITELREIGCQVSG